MPKIIAAMATIPERMESFAKAAKSIASQVDRLHVYVNGFTEMDMLWPITGIKNISFMNCFDDIGANGKFFFLDHDFDHYFSVDDDFVYPPDYVEKMISKIEQYKRKAVVCVHGSILPAEPIWYYERINVYPARTENLTDKFVNLPGTGTVAFHKDTLPTIRYKYFEPDVKCDLKLGIYCRAHEIPVVSIAREANWLRPIKISGPDYWSKALINDEGRTELAKSVNWEWVANDFETTRPIYWDDMTETHMITRYRFFKRELAGITDYLKLMTTPRENLKGELERIHKLWETTANTKT